MTLLTMARYEWFEEWEGTKLGKRGQDYLDLKNSMAQELLEWALTVFPQLRDKVHINFCMKMYVCLWIDTCSYIVALHIGHCVPACVHVSGGGGGCCHSSN